MAGTGARGARRTLAAVLLAAALAPGPALAAPPWSDPDRVEHFRPRNGTFLCEIPEGWTGFEEETPRGVSVHLFGPVEAQGLWRAAYHVHSIEGSRPGFLPARDFLKAQRARIKSAQREATELMTWRVDRRPAKVFEVREQRFLPHGRLPAAWLRLHHFYAVVPNGRDDYFLVKLSTTEESYLKYREEFRRFLASFKPTGM